MAIAGALMVSAATAAYANPVTDADDPAYVELTAVADNAKAKGEAVSPAELEKLAVPKADVKLVDKMVEITRKAAGEGAIITMSMHMPNFDLVERRAAVTGSTPENRDHYMNYTTHISEGNVVHRILPGGRSERQLQWLSGQGGRVWQPHGGRWRAGFVPSAA